MIENKTGDIGFTDYKYIIYNFDIYEIKVRLDNDNKFLGIDEIKLNKNFLNNNPSVPDKIKDIEKYFIFEEE